MYVCVFLGSLCLKIVVERWFWKIKMLFGSLIEVHAWLHSYLCFSLLKKLILSYLNTSSTPSRHLAICRALKLFLIAISTDPRQLGGSIEKVPRPSIAYRQLVDRSSFCSCVFALFLNTFSTTSSVDVVFLDTFLKKWLDTSRHLYVSRITKDLYKGQARSDSHFSRSLSRQKRLFTSQTSLTHSKSSSQVIFELLQVFSSLGMFLFSHLHAFSCFET